MFKNLLNDEYVPITSSLGFLETPVEEVVSNFIDWKTKIHCKHVNWKTKLLRRSVSLTSKECSGSLNEILEMLLPLTSHVDLRYLLVPTKSKWTAYFANNWQGGDPSPPISYLSERIRCRGVHATYVPNTINEKTETGEYGASILEIFSPEKSTERSIFAMNDGGRWVFDEYGDPKDFENLEAYKAKRIKDRFPPELLQDYLMHLGIDAYNEGFYISTNDNPAFLIEKHGMRIRDMKEYTLEEALNG